MGEVERLVVVGASLAGLRAVEAVRREGYTGRVILVGDETELPYDRPPLSKVHLDLARDGVPIRYRTEQELTGELDVELRLGVRASGLDAERRVLLTDIGEIGYDRLVVATGAHARRVGLRGEGVTTLRTLADADRLRGALADASRVVVLGAGVIGAEVASAASAAGARVTLLEAASTPLVRAVGEEVGAALSRLHARHGVDLRCGARAVDCETGADGRVSAVRLADGEDLPADLVVVGVGATPTTEWLRGSKIELAADGGVLCDAYGESSLPGVYAAGDVAWWPNGDLGPMRLENWTNAAEQGAKVAVNAVLPERRTAYTCVPYFWSDWYAERIQFIGVAEADEVVWAVGDPGAERFLALYRRDGRLVGACALNHPRVVMKLRRVIATGGDWGEALDLVARLAPRPAAAR